MRIDAYNKIAQVYDATSKVKSDASKRSYNTDKVEISSFGKDLQIAKKAVANSDDVRADKIAEMKAKYNSDSYQIDLSDVADMFMRKLQEV